MPLFSASRFFKKPIKKYSLGMKEILAFIYTVSLEADLIIVDELMNGLDNAMRAKAFQILKELFQNKNHSAYLPYLRRGGKILRPSLFSFKIWF
ncbi:hypothetical protein [Lactococcus petauri]|uniref:ATPase AAA-type core domain-containing protein n=1 Tax=Lactococcus petauri TaxID=1940789 RepID=A0ABZ2SJ02_9LACT|nr:hypothetical protein [Lactococcus petauri]OAL08514.1 ABC transporter ATP-binding protein YtrB [Lactococcus garvieae]MCI3871809.1 hypothetical protein [Lactococcus petauri]MCQ8275665.1 hypothetical protein [Lactococcus petauri]MCR6589742.1 hypothetical protein [Lactococcus petauri]MCU7363843.1 hypothetical protein [Lactococcus petauri]